MPGRRRSWLVAGTLLALRARRGGGAERGRRAVPRPVRAARGPAPTPGRDAGAGAARPAPGRPRRPRRRPPPRPPAQPRRPRRRRSCRARGGTRGCPAVLRAGPAVGGRGAARACPARALALVARGDRARRRGARRDARAGRRRARVRRARGGQDDVRARRARGRSGVTEPVTSPTFVVGAPATTAPGRRAPRPLPARRARRRGPGAARPVLRRRTLITFVEWPERRGLDALLGERARRRGTSRSRTRAATGGGSSCVIVLGLRHRHAAPRWPACSARTGSVSRCATTRRRARGRRTRRGCWRLVERGAGGGGCGLGRRDAAGGRRRAGQLHRPADRHRHRARVRAGARTAAWSA